MIRTARSLAVMVILLGGSAMPASAAERLSGEAIRQLFEGNTVSGRYNNGRPFSEFHHRDGRATGHNRNVPNHDACWTTTQEAVCYYYGPHETRRTYCFTVERSGQLYVLRTQREGRINGIATIEPGDPHGHTGKVPAWNCDGLISRRPDGATRLAGR